MFGIRFSFVATRSGLTRVRHFVDDTTVKKEALAFARRHARGPDETFYKRTLDYNMLINETAVLVQVPFNLHQKIAARLSRYEMDQLDRMSDESMSDASSEAPISFEGLLDNSDNSSSAQAAHSSPTNTFNPTQPISKMRISEMDLFEKLNILVNTSLHAIATQSIIVSEGNQRAVAGVTGVFYDYAQFVLRILNTTNSRFFQSQPAEGKAWSSASFYLNNQNQEATNKLGCGYAHDTIDCLLVDNNGYILMSEELEFVGRHLAAYDPVILKRLVESGVYNEINITDYQSICLTTGERQTETSGSNSGSSGTSTATLRHISLQLCSAIFKNFLQTLAYFWTIALALGEMLIAQSAAMLTSTTADQASIGRQSLANAQQSMMALIPNKTFLRPCERVLTRHETRPGVINLETPEYYKTQCDCPAWFVYEQVAQTNLILIIVDTVPACRYKCDQVEQQHQNQLNLQSNIVGQNEKQVCSMIERESKMYKKTLDSCFAHHPDEEHIQLCGSAV